MAVLAKMVMVLLIFQTMHYAIASDQRTATPRIRKAAQPIPNAELPDYSKLLNRRGGVLSRPSVWPRTNLALDTSSCSSHASYLAELIDNIDDMIGSAISGLGIIRDTLGVKRRDQTADERAKMDFFMSMYGLFDPTRTADITRARARITDAESFAQQLADGLSLDTLKTTIFCDDNHLYASLDKNNEPVLKSSAVPTMTDIYDMTGKCAGDANLLAFMMTTTTKARDVMTICPGGWDSWKTRYISQYAAKSLSDMVNEYLDTVAEKSPELTLLHELTHAESFFGNQVLEDRIIDGKTAYRFNKCYKLGQSQTKETDVSSVLALSNADTFAYLCAAMYLDMCNWRDGTCKDPSTL